MAHVGHDVILSHPIHSDLPPPPPPPPPPPSVTRKKPTTAICGKRHLQKEASSGFSKGEKQREGGREEERDGGEEQREGDRNREGRGEEQTGGGEEQRETGVGGGGGGGGGVLVLTFNISGSRVLRFSSRASSVFSRGPSTVGGNETSAQVNCSALARLLLLDL